MGYLTSCILLICGIVEFNKYKTLIAPSVLFSVFWSIISLFAALRLFNLAAVEFKAWFLILLGTLSFVFGTQIKIKQNHFRDIVVHNSDDYGYIPVKLFWALFTITGISMTYSLVQTALLYQNSYSVFDIKNASLGRIELEGYSYIKNDILRSVIEAIETLIIATGIDFFFRDVKHNWKYILPSVYLSVGTAINSSRRWVLLYFVVELLVCRSIMHNGQSSKKYRFSIPKRQKGKFAFWVCLIIILVVFLQISMARGVQDVLNHLYGYLCGCVPLLDLKVKAIDKRGVFSFIFASQYGFWNMFFSQLKKLTGFTVLLYEETVKHVMTGQQFLNIGWGSYNAFTTCFYYLYADFRYLGIVVGMVAFGMTAGTLFRRVRSGKSSASLVPYLIISQMIFKSIQVYPLESSEYLFLIIIMIIIDYSFKRKKQPCV